MSDKPTSDDSSDNSNKDKIVDEPIKGVSGEEGIKSVENLFKAGGNKSEDVNSDEDKEFLKYLKNRKKARDLGLDEPSVVINQGGVHIKDSRVENYGDFVGNDKTNYSNTNTGGFSGEARKESPNKESIQSIELVFDRCEDIKQRSFMIALAVLNGCNYRIVIEASQRLLSILQPQAEVKIDSDVQLNSVEKKRSEWLKEISAYLDDGYEITEYGKSRIKTVLFVDQEAALSVLFHVWYEYNNYEIAILKWLRELGEHPNLEVRMRAAAVVGQLATYEFQPIRKEILSLWAKSDKQSIQTLAALALAVIVYEENDETAQQSLNLLHHWSGLQNSPRLQKTAIITYGSYVGLLFPQQALDNLKIIVQSGDGQLFPDVAQAVVNLFDSDEIPESQITEIQLLILNALKGWINQDQKTSIHQLSLVIFWGLMSESWVIKDNIRQPTLLWLAKQHQDFEELTVFFVKHSLNLEFTRDLMLPELLNWLKFVDKHQSLYKTLARIIFTLAQPGKEGERICSYLNKWSRSSETAKRALSLINKYS